MTGGHEDTGRTIDADRAGQLRCRPGERVRMELGFRWDAEPEAASARDRHQPSLIQCVKSFERENSSRPIVSFIRQRAS